jgi:hypothetical protein
VVALTVTDEDGETERVSKTISVEASSDDPSGDGILSVMSSPAGITVTIAGILLVILAGLAGLTPRRRS